MDETVFQSLGKTWVSADGTKRRIYFADTLLAELIGLSYTTYKTGNIRAASLHGQTIANGKAERLRTDLRYGKAYYDCVTGELKTENLTAYAAQITAGLRAKAGLASSSPGAHRPHTEKTQHGATRI